MKTNFLAVKQKMQGATIVEVMVSVFLLTFGILALMLAQVRSVAGVGEAKNRTLIAQAAEALAEGMQVNPTVTVEDKKKIILGYKKYIDETGSGKSVSDKGFTDLTGITDLSKDGLMRAQLDNFETALSQIPEVAYMHYIVCADSMNPAAPTLSPTGVFDGRCKPDNLNNPDRAVIKVAWRMKNTASNDADGTSEFTYVLKVKG